MGSSSEDPQASRASSQRVTYVVPHCGSWVVRSPDPPGVEQVFATLADAVVAASGALRISGGRMVVDDHTGRRLEHFVLGREPFGMISAVEGAQLTEEMQALFREFDREGLSHEDRRRAIARKYGAKAG